MPKGTFPDSYCQSPHPCGEPLLTHASTRDPPTLAGSFASASCGVTAPFLYALVRTKFCLCSPRLESVSPSPVEVLYIQEEVAAWAQEGIEELSHIEGQEGRQ